MQRHARVGIEPITQWLRVSSCNRKTTFDLAAPAGWAFGLFLSAQIDYPCSDTEKYLDAHPCRRYPDGQSSPVNLPASRILAQYCQRAKHSLILPSNI